MNLRHAAALALVGWCLISPPPKGPTVPLAKWTHIGSFDTAVQCETRRAALADSYKNGRPAPEGMTSEQAEDFVTSEVRCIASDDPRLAKRRQSNFQKQPLSVSGAEMTPVRKASSRFNRSLPDRKASAMSVPAVSLPPNE